MADKSTLEQMLEHLVNDDTAKAEELFHEYVVAKSREIYEDLIEEEVKDEEVDEASKDEEAEDKEVDEASKDEDKEEDKVDEATDEDEVKEDSKDEEVDEEFEEVAVEADDEDEGDMDAMGGDATDDLEADITGDDEEGEKEPEELFQDLDSIVDELQAKFDEIKGGEEGDEMDMDAEKEEETFAPEASADPEGDAELATMREYVEKVAGGHGAETKGGAESADNKKSVVDNMKNDMGGTTANIAKGGEESGKNDGGLADITPKEENAGNVNTPGSKNATKMSNEKGHGAEKKGAAEQADNKQSLFRGRR